MMGDLDPHQESLLADRMKKLKRIAIFANAVVVGVLIYGLTVTTHEASYVITTAISAAVLLNVCLFALKTALRPIPKPNIVTPVSIADTNADTEIDEPSPTIDPTAVQEPFSEPVFIDASEESATASLVEVEEFPTHPPFDTTPDASSPLAEQDTELDPDRAHLRNPDGPTMTVPTASTRANSATSDDLGTDGEQ